MIVVCAPPSPRPSRSTTLCVRTRRSRSRAAYASRPVEEAEQPNSSPRGRWSRIARAHLGRHSSPSVIVSSPIRRSSTSRPSRAQRRSPPLARRAHLFARRSGRRTPGRSCRPAGAVAARTGARRVALQSVGRAPCPGDAPSSSTRSRRNDPSTSSRSASSNNSRRRVGQSGRPEPSSIHHDHHGASAGAMSSPRNVTTSGMPRRRLSSSMRQATGRSRHERSSCPERARFLRPT